MSRPTRPLSEWSLDELLQWGVQAAEEQLAVTDGGLADKTVKSPAVSQPAGKRARAVVSGNAGEQPPSDADGDDSRPFVLFAKAKRPRSERLADALRAPAAPAAAEEEPNAAHVVVSDPGGLVPLSEDAPFKSLGLNDWLVRTTRCNAGTVAVADSPPLTGWLLRPAGPEAANACAARLHPRRACWP